MDHGIWYQPGGAEPPVWLPSVLSNAETWIGCVRGLYMRGVIDIDQLDALLAAAVRGERPDHPDIPLRLPFQTEDSLR